MYCMYVYVLCISTTTTIEGCNTNNKLTSTTIQYMCVCMYVCINIQSHPDLNAAKLDAIIAGITVLAMQLMIPYPNIGAIQSISKLHVAYTTLEAVDVIKQQQGFNYHGSSAS